jgi:hypothetical protein
MIFVTKARPTWYNLTMLTDSEAIDRIIKTVTRTFSVEVAQRVADLRIDPELDEHLSELAELANEGELTPEQRSNYLSLLTMCDMLALLRAEARAKIRPTASVA